MPRPLFNVIKDNELLLLGQSSGVYASAIGNFIRSNTRPENHLLKLHLDDCNINDEQFSTIILAIKEAKMGLSLQSLTYSNNGFGPRSSQAIGSLLQASERLGVSKSLKQLSLNGLKGVQPQDLRNLFLDLAEHGANLTGLKIRHVNLNDPYIFQNMNKFLENNYSLLKLELSACNLTAKQLLSIAQTLPTL